MAEIQVSSSTGRSKKRGAESTGEASCAECRRSKQKCDKQWPCSNCRKRGCGSICPDGEIQPSSEKEARKFNAKILQRQTALENQVEQLSNALKDLTEQRRSSSVASPATTLHGSDQDPSGSSSNLLGTPFIQNKDADHAGETGGVLRLEKDGESIYIGAGGSSWALQQAVAGQEPEANISYPRGQSGNYPERRAQSKPLMDPHASAQVSVILSSLPDLDEATSLVRIYFRYVHWLYSVVSEKQIGEDLALLWRPRDEGTPYPTAQRMAVVVMVLALGALFSPNRSHTSTLPQHLYDASRKLLDYGLYLRHFTLSGVQALHLAVSFLANTRDSYMAQEGWVLLGTAGRLAQAQGLHIDGSKWSLPAEELESRRRVFHELLMYDRLQALAQGRPVFAASSTFNTQKPMNVSAFNQQKYALSPLFEAIVAGVSNPSFRYSEALRLDRAIREVEGQAPPSLRGGLYARLNHHQDTLGPHSPEPIHSLHTAVQRHMHTLVVNKALLFLHRPWLGHILSQNIPEPLNSGFGISFSASIASAEALVENMSSALIECPHEARSFWFFIFHTFSAVVVLAACIIRAPQSLHVLRTWEALQAAARIFAEWPQGPLDTFACRALPIVSQLHAKARDLLQSTSTFSPGGIIGEEHDGHIRELLGFRSTAAGQSRPGTPLLPSSSQSQLSSPQTASNTFPGPSPSLAFSNGQALEWDPSVLSLQNLPHMDLDGLLEGNAFQGDFVTQGLDWIFDL